MALIQKYIAFPLNRDLFISEKDDDSSGGELRRRRVSFGGDSRVMTRRNLQPLLKSSTKTNVETMNGKKVNGACVDEIQRNTNFVMNHEYLFGRFVEERFVFRQAFVIRSYEIGPDQTATMETLMNLLQETALNHVANSGVAGSGFGATREMSIRKLIWVVTRIHVQIDEYSSWGDVVEIDTWVNAAGKNGMRRDWIIRDSKTQKIITRATSPGGATWMQISTSTTLNTSDGFWRDHRIMVNCKKTNPASSSGSGTSRKRRAGKEIVAEDKVDDIGVTEKRCKNRHGVMLIEDDDFVAHLPPKIAGKKGKSCKGVYPSLNYRTSTNYLVVAISEMNAVQKQQITNMGFGDILQLKIKYAPPKMAYWILDNFDCNRCSIKLEGGSSLRVCEEDVSLIFGLPRGPRRIESKTKNHSSEITEKWKKRFSMSPTRISAKDVADDMMTFPAGGEWFKRQFLVLLSCCLAEKTSNYYVSPQVLDCFIDVDAANQLNWCEYIVRCLIDHCTSWQANKEAYFCGPTLFITLLYVDRVVKGYRRVPRSVPVYVAWNGRLLERQKLEIVNGGFGKGFVDEPVNPTMIRDQPIFQHRQEHLGPNSENPSSLTPQQDIDDNIADHVDIGANTDDEQHLDNATNQIVSDDKDMRVVAQNIIKEGKLITSAMSRIIDMVKSLSPNAQNNDVIKKTLETAMVMGNPLDHVSCSQPALTQDAIDFWNVPDHIAQLEAMTVEAMKIWEFKQGFEGPSFSLGLTQDFANVNDAMRDTACVELTDALFDHPIIDKVVEEQKSNESAIQANLNIVASNINGKERVDGFDNETPMSPRSEINPANILTHAGNKDILQSSPIMSGERSFPVLTGSRGDIKGKGHAINNEDENIETPQVVNKNVENHVEAVSIQHFIDYMDPTTSKQTKRVVKNSEICNSPWNVRIINIKEKMDRRAKDCYFWIMVNEEAEPEEIVYSDSIFNLRRVDLQSLDVNKCVSVPVVDAWSIILNKNEKSRSTGSPLRFFATTFPCTRTIINAPTSWDAHKRSSTFADRLFTEIKNVKGLVFCNIDMYFFPICDAEHYYVVCFDLIRYVGEVIDNSSALDNGVNNDLSKYGDLPDTIIKYFINFLRSRGELRRAAICQKKIKTLTRLKMPWQNEKNKTDCGVYAMRHMESYMGSAVNDWESGLTKRCGNQMKLLRAKYCAAILEDESNVHKAELRKKADLHYRLSCEEYTINVNKIILKN